MKTLTKMKTTYHGNIIDLTKAKNEALVNKFIIYFKVKTCNHPKEIPSDLSLRSLENEQLRVDNFTKTRNLDGLTLEPLISV